MATGSSSTALWIRRSGPVALAVGLPLVAYLLTLYPGVGDRQGTGDAIEYQFVGKILAIPHEPGYPQYVLLSHLWSYLPLPLTLASKINLLSAVFTAIAGGFFFSAARRLSGSVTASVLTTWVLLLTPSVWQLSTQAEVYTLHLMWVTAVLWAALNWYRSSRQGYLVALFFFYALSFGNHLTMITLLPSLAFLILVKDSRVVLRWQNWAWAALAIAMGLAQYGLLLWRSYHPHPALLPRFPLNAGARDLLDYISGSRFVDRHFLKEGLTGWFPGLWEATTYSLGQLTLPFAALCGVGLYLGWRKAKIPTVFLALVAASVVAFAAAYGIKDSLLYTMPAWFSVGLLGAIGLASVLERPGPWRKQLAAILVVAIALLAIWRAGQLWVDENPTDLASVLAAAEPESGLLAAFKPRAARLLRLYYRYGEVIDKAFEVDFHAVNEVLATGFEDVRDQPLYFRHPRTARMLYDSMIDYRLLTRTPAGQEVFVTAGVEPLDRLVLRPLWNGSLAVTLRDRSQDLQGPTTLHLFLISADPRRSKGYLTLDTQRGRDWDLRLRQALEVAVPGDEVLMVIPVLGANTWRRLSRSLGPQVVDLPTRSPANHHTVVAWKVGGTAEERLLMTDLDEDWTLSLESSDHP